MIAMNKNNLRKTWNIIKSVINRNKKQSTQSSKFISNGKEISDRTEIANLFNNYFINIGPTLASKIPQKGDKYLSYLSHLNIDSMFLEPTTRCEVIKIIMNLKDGAPGPDDICPKKIKIIANCISHPLTKLVNLSFAEGVFPSEFKVAKVCPLFKANDPMLCNNYRPISLLSVFSKILERIMYNRLINFLNKNEILNKMQFGFRENHSTFMALITMLDNVSNALENGNCALGIFLDFQKAFDTVDHKIMLDKLYLYDIRGVAHQWFSSYLSDRKQSVIYDGYSSSLKTITCGVPQGSILGPLLFLIYINDLTCVSDFFKPILFADDTNLFCTGRDMLSMVDEINRELDKIYSWLNANKLSLNIAKTNFMLFTPKSASRPLLNITIDGQLISEVDHSKFLGVIIDNGLKWSNHINCISNKISKGIGIIIKGRKVFDQSTLLSLYNTMVYPYLSYCIQVWGSAYKYHLSTIYKLQKKAVRIVAGVKPRTPTKQLFIDLDILTVDGIFHYAVGLFMYKFVNGMLPSTFDDMFRYVNDIHGHFTRTSANLFVPFYRTSRGQKLISYFGPSTWNYIMANINTDCAISTFKKLLRALYVK